MADRRHNDRRHNVRTKTQRKLRVVIELLTMGATDFDAKKSARCSHVLVATEPVMVTGHQFNKTKSMVHGLRAVGKIQIFTGRNEVGPR